jgi:hypothetical protein
MATRRDRGAHMLPPERFHTAKTHIGHCADVSAAAQSILAVSFDHLVGAQQERLRDREAKRLGRLHVDHQLELIGAAIARQWFNANKVDMAIGFDNSTRATRGGAQLDRHCRRGREHSLHWQGVHAD